VTARKRLGQNIPDFPVIGQWWRELSGDRMQFCDTAENLRCAPPLTGYIFLADAVFSLEF
jgi:hypothetical protein